MRKFIVFGRGRSGTTVLADELDRHPRLHCTMHSVGLEGFGSAVIEPFARQERPTRDDAVTQMERCEDLLPYDWWTQREGLPADARDFGPYLDELENWSATQGEFGAIGFKIIDNQMNERAGLLEELDRREYHIVHIRRRNVVRLALSGLLAQQRGVFNARDYEVPDRRYHVDPKALLSAIRNILLHAQRWEQILGGYRSPILPVTYEDFLADRDAFHAPVLDFLGVERMSIPESNFTKMVPEDLSEVLANYEEIVQVTRHVGLGECLATA